MYMHHSRDRQATGLDVTDAAMITCPVDFADGRSTLQ
jgi:hypothetical protein